jgi:hypothetical protein
LSVFWYVHKQWQTSVRHAAAPRLIQHVRAACSRVPGHAACSRVERVRVERVHAAPTLNVSVSLSRCASWYFCVKKGAKQLKKDLTILHARMNVMLFLSDQIGWRLRCMRRAGTALYMLLTVFVVYCYGISYFRS